MSLAACACLFLAGTVTTASASIGHVYDPATSANFEPIVGPIVVAVDSASGYVYAYDQGTLGVKRYTETGAPAPFPALGSDEIFSSGPGNGPSSGGFGGVGGIAADAAGNFYISDSGNRVINKFDETGSFLTAFSPDLGANIGKVPNTPADTFNPYGIAIGDGAENLFVADLNNSVIDVFSPSGEYVRQYTASQLSGPRGVGVDSAGNVYAASTSFGTLIRFDPGGECSFGCSPTDNSGLVYNVAVNGTNDEVFAVNQTFLARYDASGAPLEEIGKGIIGFTIAAAVNSSSGTIYVADALDAIRVFNRVVLPDVATGPAIEVGPRSATVPGHVDPAGGGDVQACQIEFGLDTDYAGGTVPCAPPASPGTPYTDPLDVTASLTGLDPETTYHYRLVAANANGAKVSEDRAFTTAPAVASVVTGAATNVLDVSATLTGSLDPEGLSTQYYFEYGTEVTYGTVAPVAPADAGDGTESVQLSTPISGLTPGRTYHYRLVATNSFGTTFGADQTFEADRTPTIDSHTATDLGATTATLRADINPHGDTTTYRFEYGPTVAYGNSAPIPDGDIGAGNANQSVAVKISDLQIGVPYHFRVIATNSYGSTVSDDRTFSFFTPNCPNAHVRQETSSNTLPDCRAYELVSPEDGGGTVFFAAGPFSPEATNPARVAFTGVLGAIPGVGNPINGVGDLYVATRTATGWRSAYIGLPAGQVSQMGGPPVPGYCSLLGEPDKFQNGVLTNRDMSQFVNWNSGDLMLSACHGGPFRDGNNGAVMSNSPYLWNAEGELIDRWPTNLDSVPGAETIIRGEEPNEFNVKDYRGYRGAVAASPDLSHYVFSSRNLAFAPGGMTVPPGSAYDNDIESRTVTIISKTPSGDDIGQEPEQPDWEDPPYPCEGESSSELNAHRARNCEYIRFAGLSADGSVDIGSTSIDGSRILMSTATRPLCIAVDTGMCGPEYVNPVRLYMRVNQTITYDVSHGHVVGYLGMTPDARHVFFTSPEQLTESDDDNSVDLFRWDEGSEDLTQLSLGEGDSGNSDGCGAAWIDGCGVGSASTVALDNRVSYVFTGNGESDNFIADNGDLYFYSPELLDGEEGVEGARNLYYYGDGSPHYVATLDPSEPLRRIQVSPDNGHAAFLTRSQLTNYENDNFAQMYLYDTESDRITCVSCIPDVSPDSEVRGSTNGLFMTNDGRPFFSTADALVPQDTNELRDVYEYVEGRPQLLTSGTGSVAPESLVNGGTGPYAVIPGLVGVTADGVNAYFTGFESLVRQDRNGVQLKIYNARTNGGFRFTPPQPPCAAADECHGVGSVEPVDPRIGTGANLGSTGGNVKSAAKQRKGKRQKGKHRKRRAKHRKATLKGGRSHD